MNKIKIKSIKVIWGLIFISLVLTNFSYVHAAFPADSIVELTNSARGKNGLGALSTNSNLSSAAYSKANDMLEKDYFSHTSPTGTTPWDFISGAGYSYIYAGENLAIGYSDVNELFNAWMDSPTHRENILNSKFREIGVAVVSGEYQGSETIVVVQEFGAQDGNPQSQVASEQVSGNPENTNSPAVTLNTDQADQASFSFVKEKTSFSPQSIYAGEEVNFQVVITGDVEKLEVKAFDQNYSLLNTSNAASSDNEKTFLLKQKIETEGSTDIIVKASDKSGNSQEINLGVLEAKKKVIVNATENENQAGLFAGIKQSFASHWIIYIVISGAILTLIGFIAIKKIKLSRNFVPLWKM